MEDELRTWIARALDGTERVTVVVGGRTTHKWRLGEDLAADVQAIAAAVVEACEDAGADEYQVRMWIGSKAASRTFRLRLADEGEEATPAPAPRAPARAPELAGDTQVPLTVFFSTVKEERDRYERLVDRALGQQAPALDALTRALDVQGEVLQQQASLHRTVLDQAQEAQQAAHDLAAASAAAPPAPTLLELPTEPVAPSMLERAAEALLPMVMARLAGEGGGLLGALAPQEEGGAG